MPLQHPISDHDVRRIELGPRMAECFVSDQWIEFSSEGAMLPGPSGRRQLYIPVDVYRHGPDGLPEKVCELVLGGDDLVMAVINARRHSPGDWSG